MSKNTAKVSRRSRIGYTRRALRGAQAGNEAPDTDMVLCGLLAPLGVNENDAVQVSPKPPA